MTIAAIFPGQGAQSVGMMAELAAADEVVKQQFESASQVLGYDLWQLIQQGPAEQLGLTEYTQPAMFVSAYAAFDAFRRAGGPAPDYVAGHSLGEYTACTAAGAFAFADAVALVKRRAELMAQAVPAGEGGMAAVLGLSDDEVRAICQQQAGEQVLEAVNFNAPGQVVISGHKAAIERVLPVLKAAGAKRAMALSVSVPNHSQLMLPAVEPLAQAIDSTTLHALQASVVQNVTAQATQDGANLVQHLKTHVNSPVYWTDSVKALSHAGVRLAIEFGPGKVLTGLMKRIDKSIEVLPVYDPATLETALARAAALSEEG